MPFIPVLCFDFWGLISWPTKWPTLGNVPCALGRQCTFHSHGTLHCISKAELSDGTPQLARVLADCLAGPSSS